jgi:hypothetical protein
MIWWIYLISIAYCIWRMTKGYKKSFGDGNPIGPTPGMETLFILCFAPILAAVDITLTWIRKIKDANNNERIF